MISRWSILRALLVAGVFVSPWPARARENLDTESLLTNVIQQSAMEAQGEIPRSQTWAILPQIGYSPSKGINAGIKFTDRNATSERLTLDVEGNYAVELQQNVRVAVVAPHFFDDTVIAALEGEYVYDPTKEFFGLGNNDVGPDPASTNGYRLFSGLATLAVRPLPRLTLALTAGVTNVQIDHWPPRGFDAFDGEAFPDLVGIHGGYTNPIAFSIVYNNREEITRPTRGWNLILKVQHVGHALGSEFQYTRYILDASYLYPLLTRRQVLGLRVGGEYIDAGSREVPFYEDASLGGADRISAAFGRIASSAKAG